MVGHVARFHWIPAHMTNTYTLHWPMASYTKQSPLFLWEKDVVYIETEEAAVRY